MSRLLLALLFVVAASPVFAQTDGSAKVEARLVAERDTVPPGGTVTVALEERIRPGWHTYWINPGDAGAPTSIAWNLPSGWKAGAIQWPYPSRLPISSLMDYGYADKVWLLVDVTAPSDARPGDVVSLKATASWLVCKEICVPEEARLALPLEVASSVSPDADVAQQFAAARARLPQPSPWQTRFHADRALDLFLVAPALTRARPALAAFFPRQPGLIRNAVDQRFGFSDNGLVLRLTPLAKARTMQVLDGVVVLTSADGSVQAIDVRALPGPVPQVSFVETVPELGIWLALLFAFLGGLILNVMPCVLPVLAMKMVSLAKQGAAERWPARRDGIAYALGAVLSFVAFGLLIVVLRAGGEQIGWGFQLQEPAVVAGFALLLFAVGLNLSGVFEFPTLGFGGTLAERSGASGAFFTGVLAVSVAAPCTAPFMAAALGFALTQSTPAALAVFFALGAGFAMPFLLVAAWPGALRILPKPGPWMLRLKQVLALPMYGAALWLLWVLSQQAPMRAVVIVLAAMIVLGVGAWIWNATRLSESRRGIGAVIGLIALIAALSGLWLVRGEEAVKSEALSDISGIPSQPYTAARLAALRREGRAVFVNATAAWCITCLVNERAALSREQVRTAFARAGVVYLVADWTRRNPEITALLEAHERPGVPLYLYYAPGKDAVVLPQILTEETITAAIGQ
jgi:thiol:disulfide interchange protein DsbD